MSLDQSLSKILIVDFGSQFTQLIARRIRELGVYSEIISHKKIKLNDIGETIKGIILSGGPLNVYEINKYSFDKKILNLNIPVLGICFGHQILSKLNGGRVKQSKHREFGLANIYKKSDSLLTNNFFTTKKYKKVWMSHADHVSKIPKTFKVIASSTNSKFAIVENKKYEDAKFLFERHIVFNPKDANSYLYLAKIYNHEEDQRKEEYNLETAMLIEPNNEEILLMLMRIALKKSNYSKVKDLSETFVKVCSKLCDKNQEIQDSLKNIEPKNES